MFIVSRGTKTTVITSPKKEEVKPVVVPPVVEEPKVEEQPIEKIEYNVVKPRKKKVSSEEIVKQVMFDEE